MYESIISASNFAKWPGLMVRSDERRDHTHRTHRQVSHRQPWKGKRGREREIQGKEGEKEGKGEMKAGRKKERKERNQ